MSIPLEGARQRNSLKTTGGILDHGWFQENCTAALDTILGYDFLVFKHFVLPFIIHADL